MTLADGVVLEIDDLSTEDVCSVLERANDIDRNGFGPPAARSFVLGSLFLTSSLRTRVGFATAAARMGGSVIEVGAPRHDTAMTAAETERDTLRTLSGMVDVLVTRTAAQWDRTILSNEARCPVINAGDGHQHPTQALIDLAAIRRFAGPEDQLHIGICGDLDMRAVVSLVRLLDRFPPAELTLIGCVGRRDGRGPSLRTQPKVLPALLPETLRTLDVLYVAGFPPGPTLLSTDRDIRTACILGAAGTAAMPSSSIVLSPLPLIDEITVEARRDHRFRAFDQSDGSVSVRAAVLEGVLDASERPKWGTAMAVDPSRR